MKFPHGVFQVAHLPRVPATPHLKCIDVKHAEKYLTNPQHWPLIVKLIPRVLTRLETEVLVVQTFLGDSPLLVSHGEIPTH